MQDGEAGHAQTPSRPDRDSGRPHPGEGVVTGAAAGIALGPGGYALPRFAPVIPDPALRGGTEGTALVTVGAGLTGLTLAADLATRGIHAVLLDDDDTVGARGASSRRIVHARKSVEVMARLGVAQRMLERGVAWTTGTTLSGHDAVYRFSRASDARLRLARDYAGLVQREGEVWLPLIREPGSASTPDQATAARLRMLESCRPGAEGNTVPGDATSGRSGLRSGPVLAARRR
jgi:hypothetical protein